MRSYWTGAIVLILLSLKVGAATDISIGSELGVIGDQVTIPVSLASDDSIVGLQLDVHFDAAKLSATAVQKGSALQPDHVVQSNELSLGQVRILLYSEQNTIISDGEILQLGFGVAEGAPLGPVTVSLSGVLLADPNAAPIAADNVNSGIVTVTDTPPAVVQDRMLFYNNSSFDTTNDADAIATDKTALLPGGVATFANYSSYSRGINGVMIDVSDLAEPGNIGADDFVFKVGNTDDPSSWSIGSMPVDVQVLSGAGTGASDRIVLIWVDDNDDNVADPNEAVTGAWLQITIAANADTGLSSESIFYFGNGPGEVGDRSGLDANVNIADVFAVFNNQAANVDVSNVYDHDRDRAVNIVDLFYTFNHQAAGGGALRVIDLSGVSPSGLETQQAPELSILDRSGFVKLISNQIESPATNEDEMGGRWINRIERRPVMDGAGMTFRIIGEGISSTLMYASSVGMESWELVPQEWISRVEEGVIDVTVPNGEFHTSLFFRYDVVDSKTQNE